MPAGRAGEAVCQAGLGTNFLECVPGPPAEGAHLEDPRADRVGWGGCLLSPSLSSTECSDFSPPITVILLVFLCLEGLLFFTFTAVMFGTQIHSICNDETVSPVLSLQGQQPTGICGV